MFKIVVTMFIDPMIDDIPKIWMAKIVRSIPIPCCTVRGAYKVQPAPGPPPGTNKDRTKREAAGGSNQKLHRKSFDPVLSKIKKKLSLTTKF